MSKNNLYETDFYTWSLEQADYLKAGKLDKLDMENLIEEVEEMGKNRKHALKSQLIRLLHHLLKWRYQLHHAGTSWRSTIINARVEIESLLEDNPGLKNELSSVYNATWKYAVKLASQETGLPKNTFPTENPWEYSQVMDETFWPEPNETNQ